MLSFSRRLSSATGLLHILQKPVLLTDANRPPTFKISGSPILLKFQPQFFQGLLLNTADIRT